MNPQVCGAVFFYELKAARLLPGRDNGELPIPNS